MNRKQKNFSFKIRRAGTGNPREDQIREAGRIIKNGGVIVFPTTCLYGLGADALNPDGIDRIFDIKKRPHGKPLLVLIHHKNELEKLVKSVPPSAVSITDKFWPGRVTLVFEAKDTLPANLTGGTGKIGVRLCGHPVASALVGAAGCPVTGTSANLSGSPGCSEISELDHEIADMSDLILDAGPLRGGIGSTIVDITPDFPKVLREGIVPAKDIFAVF
ncbi:L-threonylcarbamoyladenylate synthase [Desulfococcaceae bacterium HSG8]|nr:L-threonylcarbamoyladenylate synthase [Desulfococcaceae bacterium HSG8]